MDFSAIRVSRRHARAFVAVCVTLALAGCAGVTDEMAGGALVSPGKYNIYTCPQLVTQATTSRTREQELRDLMARSSQGAGGDFVNAVAYRTEYLQARAQQKMIAATAKEKGCTADSASGKSMY